MCVVENCLRDLIHTRMTTFPGLSLMTISNSGALRLARLVQMLLTTADVLDTFYCSACQVPVRPYRSKIMTNEVDVACSRDDFYQLRSTPRNVFLNHSGGISPGEHPKPHVGRSVWSAHFAPTFQGRKVSCIALPSPLRSSLPPSKLYRSHALFLILNSKRQR